MTTRSEHVVDLTQAEVDEAAEPDPVVVVEDHLLDLTGTETETAIDLVVVEPVPLVAEALGLFLGTQPGVTVRACATTRAEAFQALERIVGRRFLTILVAIDGPLPDDGYRLIRELRDVFPLFLILASHADPTPVAVARALFDGADGFLDKRADPREFVDGLRRAAAGETVLVGVPGAWLGTIAAGIRRERHRSVYPTISQREQEVLALASTGLSAKGVAERLGVSERTVTTHLQNIYSKLGVHSRVAAIGMAAREGVIRTR